MSVFMIIGRSDPIYEAEFSSPAASSSSGKSVEDLSLSLSLFPSNTFLAVTRHILSEQLILPIAVYHPFISGYD